MQQHLHFQSVSDASKRRRLACIFAVTYALAFWVLRQQTPMSAGSRIDAAAVMNTPAVMHAAASPHPNDGPQSAPPRPPLPRPAAQPATASSPLPGPVTSPGEGDLPARFFFRAARNGVGATANLVNLSNDSLDITVTAVSGETHMRSVVEVSVLPHQRKNLMLEGLQVELGDQVTLHSPPFPDQNFAAQ